MDCPIIQNLDPISGFVSVFIEGKQYTVRATDANFSSAVEAVKANDKDLLLEILNPALKIQKLYAKYEQVEVKDGNVFVNGEAISSVVADRIINCLLNGLDCLHIFKFITKLEMNPSKRAVDELYTFLEHKVLPITDNGNFLAYKALRSNYTDVHTGKFDNSVGSVLEMPRNKVDDDKNVGCSYGFHAGTVAYAKDFMPRDGHVMLVEINPSDVVSIPTDCNFQKLRTCKYKVVGEYEIDLNDPVYASRYATEYDDDVDLWGDYEDDETCSDCGELSYGNCEECDCCEGCCVCSDDDESEDEPKTEVQLTLNLDNKMTELPWRQVKVKVDTLLNHLFKSRRPAIAMAIRRDNNGMGIDEIPYGSLTNYTTNSDAFAIYEEMNP